MVSKLDGYKINFLTSGKDKAGGEKNYNKLYSKLLKVLESNENNLRKEEEEKQINEALLMIQKFKLEPTHKQDKKQKKS